MSSRRTSSYHYKVDRIEKVPSAVLFGTSPYRLKTTGLPLDVTMPTAGATIIVSEKDVCYEIDELGNHKHGRPKELRYAAKVLDVRYDPSLVEYVADIEVLHFALTAKIIATGQMTTRQIKGTDILTDRVVYLETQQSIEELRKCDFYKFDLRDKEYDLDPFDRCLYESTASFIADTAKEKLN